MDHQQHLGSTLAAIAREKAGIIKNGVPVVIGDLPADAMAVIHAVADEHGSDVVEAHAGVQADVTMEEGRARMTLETPAGRYGPLTLVACAAPIRSPTRSSRRVCSRPRARGGSASRPAPSSRRSPTTEWPARLELLTLEDGRRVLIDAAHNPDGAQALADLSA